MARILHYDTTYEQEAEDGTVTASVELRIYFTVTPGGGDDWNEPRYPAQAEFHSVSGEVLPGGKPGQRTYLQINPRGPNGALWDWAEAFVGDHQAEMLAVAADADEAEREYAADLRRGEL